MEWIAHLSDDGRKQSLKAHLEQVAKLAGSFASAFDSRDEAYRIGLLHDMGKYGDHSQKHMQDPLNTPKYDHSTAGAQYAFLTLKDFVAANAVAAHHSGLLDRGSPADDSSSGTLLARIQKKNLDPTDSFFSEIRLSKEMLLPSWVQSLDPFGRQFYIRMIFSCLVDADYLDTERFMDPDLPDRQFHVSLDFLLEQLKKYVSVKFQSPTTAVNIKRAEILSCCFQGNRFERGLYSLTVPTGGGKTISSMAFALTHAVKTHQKHIIFVVPYTSIIEQNTQVYREIFGPDVVLEHHSGVEYTSNTDEENNRLRLATENWDAPIIVTTAVQFFESLYASRTSRCRKLHNLADSVIIFDEAQMLPLHFLKPCVKVISELVLHYGATAILCTATQPALNGILEECAPGITCKEIIPDTEQLFSFFSRNTFVHSGTFDEQSLAEQLSKESQVLCIVNTRRSAQNIYSFLPEESRFHLSTFMTPHDRTIVLNTVRDRLIHHLPCHLVSTSLIECGVDVDFPCVWREETGLDSILQAAGRCNREGHQNLESSFVHIFSFEKETRSLFGAQTGAFRNTVRSYSYPLLNTPAAIHFYFEELLALKSNQSLDFHHILEDCCKCNFKTTAEHFKLIDEDTRMLYIPNDSIRSELFLLRSGTYSRALFRRLNSFGVSVYPATLDRMVSMGYAEKPDTFFGILLDSRVYDPSTGLSLSENNAEAIFI